MLPIEIASMIVKEFVRATMSNFALLPIFIIITFLMKAQYEGYLNFDINTYGPPHKDLAEMLKESVFYGVVIGFVITFITVGFGMPINTEGFEILLVIVAILALINIRYAFFTYAAGILSIISLVFKRPEVDVSSLLLLAGMINLIESILIFLNAGRESVPVLIKHPQGIVGAFVTRRYWPIPLLLLSFTLGGGGGFTENLMPGWWPVLKPAPMLAGAAALGLDCSIAVMGYSQVAVTRTPEKKSRETAVLFFVNGLFVLLVAFLSLRWPLFRFLGAVLAIAGHEAVVIYDHYREKNGKPIFKAENRGLKVLEVVPGSAAMFMGMQRGDVILRINGRDIQTEEGMQEALRQFPTFVWINIRDINGNEKVYEYKCYPAGLSSLGVLTVPREREVTYNVDTFENFGIIKNLVQRFRGFNRSV